MKTSTEAEKGAIKDYNMARIWDMDYLTGSGE